MRLVPDLVVEIASPAQQLEELAARAHGSAPECAWHGLTGQCVDRLTSGAWRGKGRDCAEEGMPTATPYAVHQTLQEPVDLPRFFHLMALSPPHDEQPRLSTTRRRAIGHRVVRYACGLT